MSCLHQHRRHRDALTADIDVIRDGGALYVVMINGRTMDSSWIARFELSTP